MKKNEIVKPAQNGQASKDDVVAMAKTAREQDGATAP